MVRISLREHSAVEELRHIELTNRGIVELVWFKQDSVLAYFTLSVGEFMTEAFPDRWVFAVLQHPLRQCHGLHAVPI